MRFDQVAVPLAPRSTANCIDLAICFLRHYLKPIAGLWATIALPSVDRTVPCTVTAGC